MRLRPTHEATIHGEIVVGHDELGGELTETKPVLESPCRFHSPDGQSLVRTASGELVEEQPTVMLPVHGFDPETGDLVDSHDRIALGMDVTLSGGTGSDTASGDVYSVDNIQMKRQRGNTPERLELTVSQHN